jgi:glutamate racemase
MTTINLWNFDSGIGGTSIWKAIHELPNEKIYILQIVPMHALWTKIETKIVALSMKNVSY